MSDLTEFEDLDPTSFHLVPQGASGFPVLLAKGVNEAMDEVLAEMQPRSHPNQKGTTKMKKSELRAALADAEAQLAKAGHTAPSRTSTAPVSAESALRIMKAAADDAERLGDVAKADGLRREIAVLKLQIAERVRENRPQSSRLGPNSVELFTRTGRLGPDAQLGGV
jgi:hypothetical protein